MIIAVVEPLDSLHFAGIEIAHCFTSKRLRGEVHRTSEPAVPSRTRHVTA
jgi:hypothetical protein